jgi:hypothetical protein
VITTGNVKPTSDCMKQEVMQNTKLRTPQPGQKTDYRSHHKRSTDHKNPHHVPNAKWNITITLQTTDINNTHHKLTHTKKITPQIEHHASCNVRVTLKNTYRHL